MSDIFTAASPDLIELMSHLLNVDPMQRCKCTEALKMPYFVNNPAPTPGPFLPMPSSLTQDEPKQTDQPMAAANPFIPLEAAQAETPKPGTIKKGIGCGFQKVSTIS